MNNNAQDIKIQSTINQWKQKLLAVPTVTGIALGGGHAIVYVERIMPEILETIPRAINGVEVEVKQSGRLRMLSLMQPLQERILSRTSRVRPVKGGYSCGCPQITAGTFSGTVRDNRTGEKLGLSNNHVLLGAKWGEQEGYENNPVYQPGPYDSGMSEDTVGNTVRGVPVNLVPAENLVDACVFRPTSPTMLSDEVEGLGVPGYAVDPSIGILGRKSGRTTGTNESTIESVGATIDIDGFGVARFTDQIIFRPAFAEGGDSGSICLDVNGNVLGLVFAGSDEVTAVCRSKHIERLLGVSFGSAAVPPTRAGLSLSLLPLAVGAIVTGLVQ
jgi:hypothetical protein